MYHYTYDAVGNRLTLLTHLDTHAYTYDVANRITAVDGTAYTWDANGNLLSDGTKIYTYDPTNRLVEVENAATAIEYAYNGLGVELLR